MKYLTQVKKVLDLREAPKPLVLEVQSILLSVGLLTKPSDVDGVVGNNTLKAFAEFKRKEYLAQPTMLGETTAKTLLEAVFSHPVPEDNKKHNDYTGSSVVLPVVGKVFSMQPLYPESSFTWGEATKGLTRKPTTKLEVENIIKVARMLQKVRDFYKKPVSVNSWLRPPAVNRAVGGVSNSRHITGDGVDIVVHGVHPFKVYSDINELWGKFGGLGKSSLFTHVDARGYAARWLYGR